MYIPPGTKAKLLLPPETANWPMRTPEGFQLICGKKKSQLGFAKNMNLCLAGNRVPEKEAKLTH
jgi:hypothetical protein